MDVQGQKQVLTGTLAMHHVGHAHARTEFGQVVDPNGMAIIREEAKAALRSSKDQQ